MPIIGIWRCGHCNTEREATPEERQGSVYVACKICKAKTGVGPIMDQPRQVIECDQCKKREVQHAPFWYRISIGVTMADEKDFPVGSMGTMFFCTRFCAKKWILDHLDKFFVWAGQNNFNFDTLTFR